LMRSGAMIMPDPLQTNPAPIKEKCSTVISGNLP